MHHFRVPPGQRSPPSSSPASLNSHICTSRPPFPAEQLPSNSGVHLPTPRLSGLPGCRAHTASPPPCTHSFLLSFQIGAGVSLPGIVAAKCGAQVTLSDSEELPQCLEISQQSCLLNHLPHVPVVGITWGRISPELLSLAPIDIILGSDVFFDPKGTLCLSGTSDLRQTAKTPFTHAVNRKQNVPIAIVPELVILAVIPALNYYTNTTAG